MARNFSLDILKLVMALMIVGLHADFLGEYSKLFQYLTVNGLFRISVPIFLIINGYFFFDIHAKKNQRIWFNRLITLYIFWMFLYSAFWFKLPDISFNSIFTLIFNIIIGYHHLWYISGMIGAALLLVTLNNKKPTHLITTAIILAIIGISIQYLGNYNYLQSSTLNELFNYHWTHRNALFFSYPFLHGISNKKT
ncbi:acyltransferase family protein [Nitrincola nitratireducens]|uniref:Acyltransferase 3 domain-containing protein n=1 Tax=Nitrincola nitratireducens TaxID=1229521 RepID=W9UPX1_9GAMM|nr:acyltransferase family protein [Nitrincola nitratireducens]EXJ09154.1 hypothetical protein D791_03941 [Nitrincola nitratireducens]